MSARRFHGLDVLRGVLLIVMAVSHLPTRFRAYSHDLWGLTSAAEGFVLVAAFLAGWLGTERARTRGWDQLRRHCLGRSFELYRYHLVLLCLALMLRHATHHPTALKRLLWFYLEQPLQAAMGATTLLYCPSLFDILPMYIVFLAATPFVLQIAVRQGWRDLLIASFSLWILAQCGFSEWARTLGFDVLGIPAEAMGSFQWFGWQLLWIVGLWMGSNEALRSESTARRVPSWTWVPALLACLVCLALRHDLFDLSLERHLPYAVSKWSLGPLRIANLFCLALVAMRFGPGIVRWSGWQFLSRLGRASLRVFIAHLVVCILFTLIVDEAIETPGLLQELSMLGIMLAVMAAVTVSWSELRAMWTLATEGQRGSC